MINISRLYFGLPSESDHLRYEKESHKRPVVVWNIEGRCNLSCLHCYAKAGLNYKENGLSTEEAKRVIDDLSNFGVPVLLFSGGEPLLRPDIFELISYAKIKGIRAVLSTNGTLITKDVSINLLKAGVSYVGISLDGSERVNDLFRGKKGAFDLAIAGIRNAKRAGIKVGLRFTVNKKNYFEVPEIFEIAEREGIGRICFYHLVYSGRGSMLIGEDLDKEERRRLIDLIIERTRESIKKGVLLEVLTVDNHADGPYIFLKLLKEDRKKAYEALKLLLLNKGNQSGIGIGAIDEEGNVHPDQFLRDITLGNVRERPFSHIWQDQNNKILSELKEKKQYIKGRCKICNFFDICGGNFRARAYAFYSDFWQEDPQCYLTDEEICFPYRDQED